ncbi:MAG: stable inheritance protein KleA, partial [bacterium]|nr:stable inheritance protein KleA [bacterium]
MDGISESVLWVTLLPEVGEPILNEQRAVLALLEQEQELMKLARLRREDAQRAAQKLAEKIKEGGNWT